VSEANDLNAVMDSPRTTFFYNQEGDDTLGESG